MFLSLGDLCLSSDLPYIIQFPHLHLLKQLYMQTDYFNIKLQQQRQTDITHQSQACTCIYINCSLKYLLKENILLYLHEYIQYIN